MPAFIQEKDFADGIDKPLTMNRYETYRIQIALKDEKVSQLPTPDSWCKTSIAKRYETVVADINVSGA